MSNDKHINDERIIDMLEAQGCSWRDYILVGAPPIVCLFADGLSALLIEDETLAFATVEFLKRHDARSFASVDDVKQEFGWDGLAKVQS